VGALIGGILCVRPTVTGALFLRLGIVSGREEPLGEFGAEYWLIRGVLGCFSQRVHRKT